MPTEVACPTCKKKTEWNDNPYRPFCSERCKTTDLGNWAQGNYAIAGDPASVQNLDSEEDEGL